MTCVRKNEKVYRHSLRFYFLSLLYIQATNKMKAIKMCNKLKPEVLVWCFIYIFEKQSVDHLLMLLYHRYRNRETEDNIHLRFVLSFS